MYMFIKGLQRLCEKPILILAFLIYPFLNFSQVYHIDNEEDISRVILDNEYIVISKFKSDSGNFISTLGGYYQLNEGVYEINLEFNSNYDQDSIKSLSIVKTSKWKNISKENNTLKGKWVMSGRYNLSLIHI